MLTAQGPAQNAETIRVLLLLVAIALILWWRVAIRIIAIALMVVLGFGALALLHDLHHAAG